MCFFFLDGLSINPVRLDCLNSDARICLSCLPFLPLNAGLIIEVMKWGEACMRGDGVLQAGVRVVGLNSSPAVACLWVWA